MARYPSGQRGQTVNLLAHAFGGSNPPLATTEPARERPGDRAGTAPVRTARDDRAARQVKEPRPRGTMRGNSSVVERQPSKLGVAGSNPVSRSTDASRAHVAQSVEHVLGKDGVTGSSPVMGSTLFTVSPHRGG